jgi:hypothetical protein
MKTKVKNVEVSARSFLGQSSQMDREIEKWTKQGWQLTQTLPVKNNRYLLTFNYEPTEEQVKKEKRDQRNGCLVLIVIAIGVYLAFSGKSKPADSSPSSTQKPPTAIIAAQIPTRTPAQSQEPPATAKSESPQTQVPNKASSPTPKITETPLSAVANNGENLRVDKPTLIPSNTSTITPTNTPTYTLTLVYAEVRSSNINARGCPSTDCGIVAVISSGEKLNVVGKDGDWYLVELSDGQTGYIRGDLMSLPEDAIVAIAPTLQSTNTPRPTQRPQPTPRLTNRPSTSSNSQSQSLNDREDAQSIEDTLSVWAGGRNVETVKIANGRPNGGERVVIVAYLSTESTDVGVVDEIFDLLDAIGVAIDAFDIDLDSVGLVAGDAFGNAAGAIAVSVDDLQAFRQGRMSRGTFIKTWSVTPF